MCGHVSSSITSGDNCPCFLYSDNIVAPLLLLHDDDHHYQFPPPPLPLLTMSHNSLFASEAVSGFGYFDSGMNGGGGNSSCDSPSSMGSGGESLVMQRSVSSHNGYSARPKSDEVPNQYLAFSAAIHKTIVMLNGGILALLQLTTNQQATSSVFEANRAAFICFCVLILFYAVLRVYEAKYLKRQFGLITRIVAHMSHMFGSLAALVLIYIISLIFALVLLLL